MAQMNMRRAFNARMLTKMIRYSVSVGSYDANNDWIKGSTTKNNIYGVIIAGNKFSQFEEGEALHAEDGGRRFSDYKSLYVTDKFPIELDDKIEYKGSYYNILQRSDEAEYNFRSYLLEKTEDWTP